MNGVLYGVSVGPGDPELITLKAVKTIRACPVVAAPEAGGAAAALGIARQSVPEIGEKTLVRLKLPMTRDPAELGRMRDAAADRLEGHLRAGRDVAFLTLGDVSIYSTFLYLAEIIRARGFEARMVAGVPSFCAAAARLGTGLAEAGQPLHILPGSYAGVDEGLGWKGAKVLMKTGRSLEAVKQALRARGLYEKAQMVQACGMPDERVFRSLDEAGGEAPYFSIILVKE